MENLIHRKLSVVDNVFVADDARAAKKKFLIRLLISLHNSGNFVFRTERLSNRVAERLGIYTTVTIFHRRMIISFQSCLALDPAKTESYTFMLGGGLNIWKLTTLEQLVYDFAKSKSIDFDEAQRRLDAIDAAALLNSKWVIAMLHFVVSYTASVIFYGGTVSDAGWSGFFGAVIYGVEILAEHLVGLSEILSFISAFIVAMLSSLLDRYFYQGQLCLFAAMYGGTIWILPGYSITIALIELYSGMVVYGSSRIIFGISQASQVGFGLALGIAFIEGGTSVPESFVNGCRHPIEREWSLLLIFVIAAATAGILNTGLNQMPGMVLIAAVAQIAGYSLSTMRAPPAVVPFVCALCVTAAARSFAWWNRNERPLIYIISGLFILVPGGVGVKGAFRSTLTGNGQQGLEFTVSMLMIGIYLAIGVFVSLVPSTKWLRPRKHMRSWHNLLFQKHNEVPEDGGAFPKQTDGGPTMSECDEALGRLVMEVIMTEVTNPLNRPPVLQRSNSGESCL